MVKIKYPVYQPQLSGNEKKYVNECLDSTWISSKGKFVNAFESNFSNYVGCNHGAAVCNGTVALHLALLALGIGEGDEVIVPTLTYIASVNAISYVGATPVFVDALESSWQMDYDDVKKKITPKTKAILCVHIYGHPCDMDQLLNITKTNNIYLIEDCAEAIGTQYKGKHVGGFGDVSTFSFYGNKTITTGEGGMVCTNSEALYNKTVHLKGQGLAKDREYWHDAIGYNYRMTNICAAIGLAQLEQIDTILLKKQQIATWYKEAFEKTEFKFHETIGDVKHSYWMCTVLIPESLNREDLKAFLLSNGIETRPMFFPIHTMPIYSHRNISNYPISEKLAALGMNLPSYPQLNLNDIEYIVNCLNSFKN